MKAYVVDSAAVRSNLQQLQTALPARSFKFCRLLRTAAESTTYAFMLRLLRYFLSRFLMR